MSNKKIKTIYDFWWLHNDTCWKIVREGRVDFYLFTLTMRYVYKGRNGNWWGTLNPYFPKNYSKKERKSVVKFKNEKRAVKWLCGETE